MSNVRSLENQLAETEHSLNATRIDLEAFKTLEGNKSAQQQSEIQNQQSELQRQQTDLQSIREELLLVQNVTNSIVKRYHPEFQGKL